MDTPFKKNLNSVSLTFLCIFYFSLCFLSSQTTILATFFFFYVFLLHILNSKKKGTYNAENNDYKSMKDCCPSSADCGSVATADHDECQACPAGQYQPVGSTCTNCVPCSSGAYRENCGKAR